MLRRLIILGPPGGGKGTLAGRLAEHLGVPHISTGDMLRSKVANESALGTRAQEYMNAGELVPDDIVIEMTRNRLAEPDATEGWILDGFPRELSQAQALEEQLGGSGPEAVVVLDVPDDEVFVRIAGRRTCPNGHVYNVKRSPPKSPGVCDIDGLPLQQREDASEEVVTERLEIYERETVPVLDYYTDKGLLHRVDGTGEPDDIYERALNELESG
ncbi:adenylate kinase [soil metagenome]